MKKMGRRKTQGKRMRSRRLILFAHMLLISLPVFLQCSEVKTWINRFSPTLSSFWFIWTITPSINLMKFISLLNLSSMALFKSFTMWRLVMESIRDWKAQRVNFGSLKLTLRSKSKPKSKMLCLALIRKHLTSSKSKLLLTALNPWRNFLPPTSRWQ